MNVPPHLNDFMNHHSHQNSFVKFPNIENLPDICVLEVSEKLKNGRSLVTHTNAQTTVVRHGKYTLWCDLADGHQEKTKPSAYLKLQYYLVGFVQAPADILIKLR